MIVSASRRTDIPAQYADWFFNRLAAGFALVRNPMNPRQIRRVSLTPDAVEGFVFWTKNPAPMLDRLAALEGCPCLFHVTITAYGQDMEPGVPSKDSVVIPALRRLSGLIGPRRVIWRYDPVLLSGVYTVQEHVSRFAALARQLAPFTQTCVFSFLDSYRRTARTMARLGARAPSEQEQVQLAEAFAGAARPLGLRLCACCETVDLSTWGIAPARCIDAGLLGLSSGRATARDRHQRPGCHCAPSVDIGAYDTCRHGCRYCYAGAGGRAAAAHDPASPLLTGRPGPQDTVTDALPPSCRRTVPEPGRLL